MAIRHAKKQLIILICSILLCGCKDFFFAVIGIGLIVSGGDTDPEAVHCIYPIDSSSDARFVSGHIASAIAYGIEQLPDGIYHEEEVYGVRGSMIISGIISRTGSNDHNFIAEMERLSHVPQSDTDIRSTISGTANYSDKDGNITITDNGTPIHYIANSVYSYNCRNTERDIYDTIISLYSNGSSSDVWNLNGYITTENGTFDF